MVSRFRLSASWKRKQLLLVSAIIDPKTLRLRVTEVLPSTSLAHRRKGLVNFPWVQGLGTCHGCAYANDICSCKTSPTWGIPQFLIQCLSYSSLQAPTTISLLLHLTFPYSICFLLTVHVFFSVFSLSSQNQHFYSNLQSKVLKGFPQTQRSFYCTLRLSSDLLMGTFHAS